MDKPSGPPNLSSTWERANPLSHENTLFLPRISSPDLRFHLATAVNSARLSHGLPTLPVHASLTLAAQSHAEDMRDRNYFSHDTLDGPSWSQRIRTYYPSGAIGECIAAAYRTPDAAVHGWLSSPGHRAILLQIGDVPIWQYMGVGYAYGSHYTRYYVLDVGTL